MVEAEIEDAAVDYEKLAAQRYFEGVMGYEPAELMPFVAAAVAQTI